MIQISTVFHSGQPGGRLDGTLEAPAESAIGTTMINIVIIGFGAIGSHVTVQLSDWPEARIKWVLCRAGRNDAAAQALGPAVTPINALDEIGEQPDLALECAGHGALGEHGPEILLRGIDLITVSSGALADDQLVEKLTAAATAGRAQLQVLSGAIGAIDALAAASENEISRLIYRGRKPPVGWKGSHAEQVIDLENLTAPACHFQGSARQAALLYPKNANVAATVALAGTGLDETSVELIADPDITENIHEIEAEGAFGRLTFKIGGKPLPDNPRTSALTALSILRAIRNRIAPIRI